MKTETSEEVEILRMQLAACGVAAMSNTKESIEKQGIASDSPYYSASYQDVCNAVGREMKLREENSQFKSQLEAKDKEIDEVDGKLSIATFNVMQLEEENGKLKSKLQEAEKQIDKKYTLEDMREAYFTCSHNPQSLKEAAKKEFESFLSRLSRQQSKTEGQ